MRQRNVKNQDKIVLSSELYIKTPEDFKGNWKQRFKNVELEIGCGKGIFIYNKAKENKSTLYIAIDISKSVVALAIKKIEKLQIEEGITLDNLKLITYNAAELENIFTSNEVDKIYLNFSDPWHKNKHEKRRLTSDNFLKVYKNILNSKNRENTMELKTDNRKFFEYTLSNLNKNNIKYIYISLDLYKDIELGNFKGKNIATEYEIKFKEKGPIYMLIFVLY